MFYQYQNYVFFLFFFLFFFFVFFFFFLFFFVFCIQTRIPNKKRWLYIFLLLKNKVKTTNIVTFSFINPFENFNHDVFSLWNESATFVYFKVCITFQRWANVDPTLPQKLKSRGKPASKYIRWANGGTMLAHKTYFSLKFIEFV